MLRNPITGIAGCCARAASGHAAAAPPSSVMNSRRLMVPQSEDHTLPHRCKKPVLCITAILATRLPQRVIFDRPGQSCLPVDVRLAPKADLRLGRDERKAR